MADRCTAPRADNPCVAMEGRRRMLSAGAIALVALASLAGAPASAETSGTPAAGTPRVALFGDSLSQEAGADFVYAARLAGYSAEVHAAGGTAPCDWLGDLAELAARPVAERPSVVIIEFTGNNFTACMRPDGTVPSDADTLTHYERDATTFVTSLLAAGVRPVFALAPAVNHPSLVPFTNDLWRTLASEYPGVGVVDAGAPVESPDGTFASMLPCAPWEHAAQGCWEGEVIVRAPDGTHFCPTESHTVNGVVGVCDVPSPGAVRYAMGLARALDAPPVTAGTS